MFRFKIGFLLFCAFFIALFCFLGVWQLHRYQEKSMLLSNYQQRLAEPAQAFSQLNSKNDTEMQFKKVTVTGTYINALTLLIQNQFSHDKVGFEVLTPLKIKNEKKLLLIDRGWIEKPKNNQLPVLAAAAGEQQITGYLKTLNDYHFTLGKNNLDWAARPIMVQKVDVAELSQATGETFYPVMLRLDAAQSQGFVRDWVIVSVLPARHLGYAVQWFVMAIVLFIAYLGFSYERTKNTN